MSKQKVPSEVRTILTNSVQIKKQENLSVPTARDHTKYKKQTFRQHVVNNQKTYPSTVRQNTLPQPKMSNETFSFTAEQLTNFIANVVIQIAQPQVCYQNQTQDMLDLKYSMCRKVSNAAKTTLNMDITGKDLFESVGSLSVPAPPKPFTFMSTKVNLVSKTSRKEVLPIGFFSAPALLNPSYS